MAKEFSAALVIWPVMVIAAPPPPPTPYQFPLFGCVGVFFCFLGGFWRDGELEVVGCSILFSCSMRSAADWSVLAFEFVATAFPFFIEFPFLFAMAFRDVISPRREVEWADQNSRLFPCRRSLAQS